MWVRPPPPPVPPQQMRREACGPAALWAGTREPRGPWVGTATAEAGRPRYGNCSLLPSSQEVGFKSRETFSQNGCSVFQNRSSTSALPTSQKYPRGLRCDVGLAICGSSHPVRASGSSDALELGGFGTRLSAHPGPCRALCPAPPSAGGHRLVLGPPGRVGLPLGLAGGSVAQHCPAHVWPFQ